MGRGDLWVVILALAIVVAMFLECGCHTECRTTAPPDCIPSTIHPDDDYRECECNRSDGVELEWQGHSRWIWE